MASIRKRGKTYQITVCNGYDSMGKKLIETTTFTPDPTKTEKQNQKALEIFVMEFEQRVKNGKYLDGEKITFKEFSEKWMKDYAIRHLEKSTLGLYEGLLRDHINPSIGHLKLSKIQPTHINALYNQLLEQRKDGKPGGYAPRTVKHVHVLINSIYSAALKWNVALDNPCSRVDPPKMIRNTDDIKFFTLEQTEHFLQALDMEYFTPCKAHDRIDDTGKPYHVREYQEKHKLSQQLKLFFYMALFLGMRKGELIALEWSDIDFNNHSVSITKSTGIVKKEIITKPPKTKSSIRVVAIPDVVFELLKEYRKEQLKYRLSIGNQWIGDNYIFIQWNGKQMYPSTPYAAFKKIIKRYNNAVTDETLKLPNIPLHGLRHTSATLLISQNVDVKTVSGRLGHAQTSTTMDIYAHSLKKMDEVAAETLNNLLSKQA